MGAGVRARRGSAYGFPAASVRPIADAGASGAGHARRVQSYAVYWNEGVGARHAGRLDVEPAYAELVGRTRHGGLTRIRIAFSDIVSVRYGRGLLRLERNAQPPLEIGSVDRPGALHELAGRLGAVARSA